MDKQQDDIELLLKDLACEIRSQNNLDFLTDRRRIGKYEYRGILGKGGQAVCLSCFDHDLQRQVVIKLYPDGLADERRERIFSEGRALAKIESPFVAECYGIESLDDGDRPYLVMQNVEGLSLYDWLDDRKLDSESAVRIAGQLARALQSAHAEGILHLDLKPTNVLIDESGNATLIDFGMSEEVVGNSSDSVGGTTAFLAPERVRGVPADERSDVYGLGALLYYLLTARMPNEGSVKREILNKIRTEPVDLSVLDKAGASIHAKKVCRLCLAHNPGDRYQDVAAVIRDLQPDGNPSTTMKLAAAIAATIFLTAAVFWAVVTMRNAAATATIEKRTRSIYVEGNEFAQFILGETQVIPRSEDFKLSCSIKKSRGLTGAAREPELLFETGNGLQAPVEIPVSNALESSQHSIEINAGEPCFVALFSLDYSVVHDRFELTLQQQCNLKVGQEIFELPLAQTQTELNEYLWLLASTKEVNFEQIQDYVNFRLMNREEIAQDNTSGQLRSVQQELDAYLVSELAIPYRVVAPQQ